MLQLAITPDASAHSRRTPVLRPLPKPRPSPLGFTTSTDALRVALQPKGERGDRRVALVHEGGGMRGAFGAGVLTGFSRSGVPAESFDGLFGVSAGLLNVMYWAGGHARDAAWIYVGGILEARNPPFFLYRNRADLLMRLARGHAGVDMQAVEHAMRTTRPLNVSAITQFPSPIWFPITDAEHLTTSFVDARTVASDQLIPMLLAASSVPALADVREVDGTRFIDGACGAPLPVERAIAEGYTDLVVVLNLPWQTDPAWYEPVLLKLLARRRGLSSRVANVVFSNRGDRRRALDATRAPPDGVRITVLAPEAHPGGTLERRESVVRDTIERGIAQARALVECARIAE